MPVSCDGLDKCEWWRGVVGGLAFYHFYRTVHMEPIIGSPLSDTFLKPCEDLVKTVNVVNVDPS